MTAGLALATLLFAAPAAAQGTGTPPDTTRRAGAGDTLQVTVTRGLRALTRVPAAVSVVGEEAIALGQPGLSLEESLRRVPGVVIDHRHNYSVGDRIAIRGFGTRAAFGVRGVRVLADGIPLTTPDGQTNLNNLDFASASRIEVIRGPASSLYGNAAGGVISVTTEEPPHVPFALSGRATVGDYGADGLGNLTRGQLKVGGRSGAGSYIASGAHTDADGFREHARVRQTVFNARVRHVLDSGWGATLVLNAADVPVAQNPGALDAAAARDRPRMAWPRNRETGAGSTTRQLQGGVAVAGGLAGGRLDLAVHGARRDLENPLAFGVIGLQRDAAGARAIFARQTSVGGRVIGFTTGFDAELQSDDRTEHNNVGGRPGPQLRRDQTDRVTGLGPFLELHLPLLADWLELTAGARYDRVAFETTDRFLTDGRDDSGARTLSAFSPMAALLARISPNLSVYANVATSFQTPTTTELINAPPPAGEPCCPGGFNTALEPQRARSAEIGARFTALPGLHVDATVYDMRIRDALVPFQVAQVEGREFFRNAGRSRHRGLETQVTWNATAALDGHVAYTLSDFRFVDAALPGGSFADNRFPGVAPHRLAAGVVTRWVPGLRLALDGVHTSAFHVTDANRPGTENPAATVFHLRGDFAPFGRSAVRPFLGVQNVTDTRYNAAVVLNAAGDRFFEPAPGRNFYLGLSAATAGWTR
jgi:iron complex outermembrane recepter protein